MREEFEGEGRRLGNVERLLPVLWGINTTGERKYCPLGQLATFDANLVPEQEFNGTNNTSQSEEDVLDEGDKKNVAKLL